MAAQVRLPKLFMELESQRTQRERRAYVTGELIRMIQDGSLSLVAIMNQRTEAKQIAGDVIFGHGVSDGNDGFEAMQHVTNLRIPPEIAEATITLEAIGHDENGKPRSKIRWVRGQKEVEGIIIGSQSQYEVPQWEHDWAERDSPATLTLREAWLALKRFGENVVKATLPQDKKDLWQCREVAKKAEQPRRGRADAEARA